MSCRIVGANILTAEEKEVLYDLVTCLLQIKEIVSNMDFITIYLLLVLSINSATSFPEINEGGTPGPGTVNCPVK